MTVHQLEPQHESPERGGTPVQASGVGIVAPPSESRATRSSRLGMGLPFGGTDCLRDRLARLQLAGTHLANSVRSVVTGGRGKGVPRRLYGRSYWVTILTWQPPPDEVSLD